MNHELLNVSDITLGLIWSQMSSVLSLVLDQTNPTATKTCAGVKLMLLLPVAHTSSRQSVEGSFVLRPVLPPAASTCSLSVLCLSENQVFIHE